MRRVMLDGMEGIEIRTPAGKPLIVSELGAGAKYGMHAPVDELVAYSEEYQALVYEKQLAMLARQPQVRGISPWVLKDFRAPLRMYQGVQDYWNRKGLVSDAGEKKQAFFVLQENYKAGWPETMAR
jgi:beta-glucuronidase